MYEELGAGRHLVREGTRIDAAIADHTFRANSVLDRVFFLAKHHHQARLHLVCPLGEGSEDALPPHLTAILEALHAEEIPVVIHAIVGGPGLRPKGAGAALARLEYFLDGGKKGVLGTLSGRGFAMDPEARWDGLHLVYKAVVRGDASRAPSAYEALARAYQAGRTDDQVEPVCIGAYTGIQGSFTADFASKDCCWRWSGEENGLAMGLRPGGLRRLSAMLTRKSLPPLVEAFLTERGRPLYAFEPHSYATLVEQDPMLHVHAAFPREGIHESLGEVLERTGQTQLRCASTDRALHVTRFFNGGREASFEGEEHRFAANVVDDAVNALRNGTHDFILVSLATADTAKLTAERDAAVEATDQDIGALVTAVRETSSTLVVISFHRNDKSVGNDTAARSPVPNENLMVLYYDDVSNPGAMLRSGGRLADVAPTLLDVLRLPQPKAMTGRTLLLHRP